MVLTGRTSVTTTLSARLKPGDYTYYTWDESLVPWDSLTFTWDMWGFGMPDTILDGRPTITTTLTGRIIP